MTQNYNQPMLELAQTLIRLDTADPPGNEQPAAEAVARILGRHGIDARFGEIGPNRTNLVARIVGNGDRPALVFSAHLDTIGVDRAEWSVDPFGGTVSDGRLYGRGSTDMKAALAAMTYAAIALKESGAALRGDLILAFTAAENSSCLGATHMIEQGDLDGAGALLISEPSSLKLFIAEKGALWLRVTASGEYGHNAFSEQRTGDKGNAIIRLATYLARIPTLVLDAPVHPLLGPPTVNVGIVRGGLSTVLIPPTASADIDIRMVPGMGIDAVVCAFEELGDAHISVEILDYKPPVTTAADDPFVRLCHDVCQDATGTVPEVEGVPYYSDGAIFAPHLGIPMVIIGPGEVGKSGSVDEYCEIDKLNTSLAIFTEVARKYLT